MSETATVTPIRLPMGSAIPEWLLVAEPTQAGAPRGNFRFAVDVDVVETPVYYLVMPIMAPGSQFPGIIDNSGMAGHHVYAPTKPVITVNLATTWFPLETPVWNTHPDAELRVGSPVDMIPSPALPGVLIHKDSIQRRPGLIRRWWSSLFG